MANRMKIGAYFDITQIEILPRFTIRFRKDWLIAFEFLFWGVWILRTVDRKQ